MSSLFPAIDWTDTEEVGEIDEVVGVMCDWWSRAKNSVYRDGSVRIRKVRAMYES